MADPLEIELQKIIEALSGETGVIPPPGTKDQLKWYLDYIIFLIAEGGGSGGGAVVPDNYFFTDTAARDAYFTSHPDELKNDVLCCTDTPVALWKWNGTEWLDSSTWVRGPKGNDGANGTDGVTPHIDATTKHWFVGTQDTGILAEGVDGVDGTDGITPHIDASSKHWFIGTQDTGIVAQGVNGTDGVTPHIDASSKHWFIGSTDTGIVAQGVDGADGSDGITPHIDDTTKHWFVGTQDTGILAEGTDGADGVTPHIDATSHHWFIGTTDTGILAQGVDGTDGEDGVTPHIDDTTKHWFIGDQDTGILAEGTDGADGVTPHIDDTSHHWFIGTVDTGILAQGADGADGTDGITPHIDSSTKHWFIGDQDTGIFAQGVNGTDGSDGANGITPHIDSTSHHWFIGDVDTGILAEGVDGTDGTDGITPHIDSSTKHWFIGTQDTGIVAEGTDGVDGIPIIWKGDLASAPDNPQTNWAYYDTTLKQSLIYDGTQWSIMTKDGITPSDAYIKPEDGIPASDLDEDVNAALDKAETALQSFTETDPTVPAWAKAESKPEYTASEVGLGNVDNTSDADKPISTATQAALDKKANIYIRLQQGTTIGNNIQGMHVMPIAPATYTADWSLTSTDGASFVRTNNNLIYTKADSTVVTIIENGTILIADYRIDEVFNVAEMSGDFAADQIFYRWFDVMDLDQRIGLLSALLTLDKSNIVNAINSLKLYIDGILQSSEVTGSPYESYAAFVAGAGASITPSKYAYVTFTGSDTWPTGGKWDQITAGDTWRLDCSDTQWLPTSNMTAATTATLLDQTATDALKQPGNDSVTAWLQNFRDVLKGLLISKYEKPSTGIPATDLEQTTQNKLNSVRELLVSSKSTTDATHVWIKLGTFHLIADWQYISGTVKRYGAAEGYLEVSIGCGAVVGKPAADRFASLTLKAAIIGAREDIFSEKPVIRTYYNSDTFDVDIYYSDRQFTTLNTYTTSYSSPYMTWDTTTKVYTNDEMIALGTPSSTMAVPWIKQEDIQYLMDIRDISKCVKRLQDPNYQANRIYLLGYLPTSDGDLDNLTILDGVIRTMRAPNLPHSDHIEIRIDASSTNAFPPKITLKQRFHLQNTWAPAEARVISFTYDSKPCIGLQFTRQVQGLVSFEGVIHPKNNLPWADFGKMLTTDDVTNITALATGNDFVDLSSRITLPSGWTWGEPTKPHFYKKNGMYYIHGYITIASGTTMNDPVSIPLGITLAENRHGWSKLWSGMTDAFVNTIYNSHVFIAPNGDLRVWFPARPWTAPAILELNFECTIAEEFVLTGGV